MRIEIDQSGKIEHSNKPTVIGFSNNKKRSIIISAPEKQKLIRSFYRQKKSKVFRYKVIALLIFLLIRNEKKLESITIDKEYPGQENLIKSYLLDYLKTSNNNIDKRDIVFKTIGKKSSAHEVAHKSFKNRKANIKITFLQIMKYLK